MSNSKMSNRFILTLMNRTFVRGSVNLHSEGDPIEIGIIDGLISRISSMLSDCYSISVDIGDIPNKKEELQAHFLKDFINEEMAKRQFSHWIHRANTIDSVLHQLNQRLEKPTLLIFFQFVSNKNNKEKDILRSIRKFIQMRDSLFLGILLISSEKLYKWDLRPYSDLDERMIEFISFDLEKL